MTPLDLNDLLTEFTKSLPHRLALPQEVPACRIESLCSELFQNEFLKLIVHTDRPTPSLPSAHYHFTFLAEPLDSPFYISFNEPTATFLLHHFFDHTPLHDPRIKKGALGFALVKILAEFDRHKLFSKMNFVLTQDRICEEPLHTVKIELHEEHKAPIVAEFSFPETFVEGYLGLYRHQLRKDPSKALCQVQVITGSTKLLKQDIQNIQINQVILLDEHYYHLDTEKGMGHLHVEGRPFVQVRITPTTLKILDINPLPQEVFMDELDNPPLTTLDTLELDLQVEFATLKIELSQLEALAPGQTLEIHKENPTHVYLTLHGQRLARGELVKVGEKMAFLVQETRNG